MQATAERRPDDRADATARAPGNVLRGMLVRLRRDPAPATPAPGPRNPERVIAAAVSRAADRVHQLPVYFDRVETSLASLAEITECLPDQALLSLIEGPGDAIGVVSISPALLGSLIEMQAIGRVSSRAPVARRPTATDAAVCADFVNACLGELAAELSTMPGHEAVAGYRYASFLGDPRPLDLLLEDVVYRRLHVELRAGGAGQRDGALTILLPASGGHRALPDLTDPAVVAPSPEAAPGAPELAADLSAAVATAGVRLNAVLARRKLSLGELKALAPGQMLTLPRSCLDGATLETAAGQVIATGKAGESAGCHALRLHAAGAAYGGAAADWTPGDARGVGHEPAAAIEGGIAGADAAPPADLDVPDPFRAEAAGGMGAKTLDTDRVRVGAGG